MAHAFESRIDLPTLPVMVAVARAHIAGFLHDTPRVFDAQVVTSELVTNSVLRSSTGFTLSGRLQGYRVRVEVAFRVTPFSRPAAHDWFGPGFGPGLGLVSLLADGMGARHANVVTVMWAELAWDTA